MNAALLQQAAQRLNAGDVATAEAIAGRLLGMTPGDAGALHLLALVRLRQNRTEAALPLLRRAIAAAPDVAAAHLNLATALAQLGRDEEAVDAFAGAAQFAPRSVPAQLGLGRALERVGRLQDALVALRAAHALQPDAIGTVFALGGVLLALREEGEAEALFRAAIARTDDPGLLGQLWNNLALAQRSRGDNAAALESCETAQQRFPAFVHLDAQKADALDALGAHDAALALLDAMLRRDPHNLAAQAHRGGLAWRLGRDDIFAGFDAAPQTPATKSARAALLLKLERAEEAAEIYTALAAAQPDDVAMLRGLGAARAAEGRPREAVQALDAALARAPQDAGLHGELAGALLRAGDPQRAAQIAARGHQLAPRDQMNLALLGTAWRAMGDARDEELNRYDTLIRVFDLEPPRGFCDMASFNAELSAWLDGRHPDTREFLEQSLRGGTQTHNHLFGAGHDLVERLAERIRAALDRYIAQIDLPTEHPFAARRRQGFRIAGSWSSRLRDHGFHANHIHQGWISSCYYVAVPDAVRGEAQKQGWIKFGEPSFHAGLAQPVRRAIQPAPGRLVLFPSYMWHGTVPFHDATARTTIAFDAVPA